MKITKEQREAILHVYQVKGKQAATEVAMSIGLSELYAVKLARARGIVPRLRVGTHPRYEEMFA